MANTYHNHLRTVISTYIQSNPKSRSLHNAAASHLPGGNTRTVLHATPFPLTITSASGCTLTTADNHELTDYLSEYTAGLLGHSNPRIVSAIKAALANGYNYGAPNAYEKRLAELVCERFKPAIQLVRFTNSGTESNMLAIATAKAYTNRPHGKVLVFANGYHGSTIGFRDGAPDAMTLPHQWVVAPYGSIDGCLDVLKNVRDGELAAILVEPMQGSAGAIECTPEFLRFLRNEATARGALLIVDEVMTSRLTPSGLAQEMGITPDLMTLGKWVGGGMTFGAFGGKREIMEMFDPDRSDGRGLSHAGTFNNNVVSMAAGCEALRIYDETALRRLNELGDGLKMRVNSILMEIGLGTEHGMKEGLSIWMSGRGSILAMRLAGKHAETVKALFWHHMLEHGVYLATRGFVALNIELDESHVDKFVNAVEVFVKKYLKLEDMRAKL